MEQTNKKSLGFGIASFILGLLSIILFLMPYFTLFISIAGFVFGILQNKKGQTGLGITGIILSSIGFTLALGIGLLFLMLVVTTGL